ncbi:hypothetical protein KIM372_11210 [Bombiscardovia nodaiensis]|uniref:Thiamine diphosphokinase n=1 Tax=Bombiscardovia nodaiensis TaxID=2932181 RepID=A0ABM8B8J9_9BIFI|nr:hypothetical protein KIM372_11210 [Bombiscardovia nodaiensis]
MSDGEMGVGTCIILGAGQYYEEAGAPPADNLVIAADGGADQADRLGLVPDLTVGDFDSIASAPPSDGQHIALPAQKDDTDMLAALKLGWERGYRRFHIYGGLGGRIDHSIANIATLCQIAQAGGIGTLHGDQTLVTAICQGSLSFPAWRPGPRTMISVFSASDCAHGVSERGLKYELDHADMDMVMSRGSGVSNEFVDGQEAQVSVEDGTLIITYPLAAPSPAGPAGNPRWRAWGFWRLKSPAACAILRPPANNLLYYSICNSPYLERKAYDQLSPAAPVRLLCALLHLRQGPHLAAGAPH